MRRRAYLWLYVDQKGRRNLDKSRLHQRLSKLLYQLPLLYTRSYIEYQITDQIYRRLLKPIGPTPRDLLRYFRGEDIESDADCQDVMGIEIFGMHWDYASDLIYFDQKYPIDPKMEAERVSELKRLTKIFFRAIFDCFNEALRP